MPRPKLPLNPLIPIDELKKVVAQIVAVPKDKQERDSHKKTKRKARRKSERKGKI